MRLFDFNKKEVVPGDVLLYFTLPGTQWEHQFAMAQDGYLVVKDRNNNINQEEMGDFLILGPYWENLDLVDDENLEMYWNTTRKQAEAFKKLCDAMRGV